MIGRLLSERYKILKYLGGGMSSVYLAEDIILNRNVVVKMIKVDAHDEERSRLRFQREVQSTIQLSHPNIVNVLDVDETDEYQLLVTEVVDGPTLKQYIKENHPISIEESVNLAVQILDGIEHAHNRGIIHRDIKPQNILLDGENRVRITDFGIAKALSETRMTETNQVMGSVQYISPEQAKGQNTDERTDIYSFGIVLFELLTGEVPFSGETPVSVALKQISEKLPEIDDYRTIPQGLKNIILKCTEKKPADRYRHVDMILEDLRKYDTIDTPYMHTGAEDGSTIQTGKIKPAPKAAASSAIAAGPPEKKKSGWLWLIPLLFMLAAAGLGAYMMFGQEEEVTALTMPDFQGMSLEAAEASLAEHQLEMGEVTEEYNETFEAGEVVETSPKSGATVEFGTAVDFIVSAGEAPFVMTDFTGENFSDIQQQLNEINFNRIDLTEVYADAEPGTILSQSIGPGEEIRPDEHNLQLEVSRGVEPVEIVNYAGEPFEEARDALEQNGFNVVISQELYSEDVEQGAVISQDPSYGSFLPGSTINLVVSIGPEPPQNMLYSTTVNIPYGEEDEDDDGEDSSEEAPPKTVNIHIEDANNPDIGEVYETFEITEDTAHTVRLEIEPGETGAFMVEVDGEEVIDEEIPYEE
ncbi:Stk1 family PASTA domain-containing Ser/Thr kinase [Salinicoccus halitifaciens]|uniref:non-specific serine/threonine protein kinase n=1 Tax=Salinicoccus halitifaciens TaxID=1073415 RepID=A0ABV2E7P4_9STAP|nr:Stk1 family PASTA domain-containing Ser/Thr kinase [Salinicoccus halitifaciens]MCD2136614.1 Stk1 family PASTA domain-containing Ser/Thr kinase [Salinicoccus halitifaciens]